MKFGFPCVGAAHETTGSNTTASNAGNMATISVAYGSPSQRAAARWRRHAAVRPTGNSGTCT
eukprot:COSAG03_NODE_2034_length_3199_cov_1282.360000_2_plen_62_part_00